jgi:hypothetical protein
VDRLPPAASSSSATTRLLLPAPPARLGRAPAGALQFLNPVTGAPLPGGLAMDVVLALGGSGRPGDGSGEEAVTAAMDAALLEAALRGEVGGAPTASTSKPDTPAADAAGATTGTCPPSLASTPPELIALYSVAGRQAIVARIAALRAALTGFGGPGCVIGVEVGGGGAASTAPSFALRVVGLWTQQQ